jgi:assimilatory nitrate reductase catalytic subunit
MNRSAAARETRSTCPYCGVGCGVVIESSGDQITGVRGDPDHPANFGRLCSKGSTLHLTAAVALTRQTRLLQPLRRLQRDAAPEPIGWDAALDLAADRFAATVQAHGPDSVGFYISGQLLTEDYYVFNKLAKGVVGTNNVDTNSRLCMSSAVAGYKATLGADAPPACYEDLDHAHAVFIVGSNMAWAHPVLFRRLEDARRANPAQKWVVIDPRRTETAAMADLHLALAPGTDVALFHGLLHLLLWEDLTDAAYIAAHTTGFAELKARVRDHTPRDTARLTGLKEADIVTAARWFGASPATLSLYCQGLNQSSSGTAKNAALINLHLATGQIGKPGAGPFSLTGQPNAMGGREVGGLATLLSAHRDLANPVHRAEVAALWGVPDVPATPGKSAVEMFQAAADGQIKALWIACTNPAQSMPDQATVRRALQRCEFVVLQEAFATTATAPFADLLLPATTWGEKDGTVTNSERCISRVRPAVAAPGAARDDWRIGVDFGRRLAERIAPERAALLDYADAESVWNEHRASTRGRDLDITGLSYALLDAAGPQRWPCTEAMVADAGAGAARAAPRALGRLRLYEDCVFPTADGRARFADVPYRPVAEPRDARFPFSLTTGRLRDQWHGMSRTGTLGRLFGHEAEPVAELHGQDMARLKLVDGDLVRLASRRGTLVLPVRASDAVAPTQAFVAMHWGDEVLGGTESQGVNGVGAGAQDVACAGVNALTTSAYCPQSKQPELKHCAIRVEKADLPWRLVAVAWLPGDQALAVRESLKPLWRHFGYAACVPFGREPDAQGRLGLAVRAAALQPPPAPVLALLRQALGVDALHTLAYQDARRAVVRALRVEPGAAGETRLAALWLAGDVQGEAWLRSLVESDQPLPTAARHLLAPNAQARQAAPPRSPQVCTCFNVTQAAIVQSLALAEGDAPARLAQVQAALHCGTQCGSCLPTLRVLATAAVTAAGTGTVTGEGAVTGAASPA